ncbi:YraN family protein [Paraferrimonas sp. SM1919]|uniref:YraN family protein n=1 Tax=Paraferrimonas sp. SM1919 TaxID=2662263 RepID=UPI001969C4B7|nr:YraN family protein [Paraferrimonas sp. SM1919]
MTLGQEFEKQAAQYLQSQGLKLVGQNINYKFGEIDLVMKEANQWVFVEVKYRSTLQFGGALAAISQAKKMKIIRAVEAYVQQHNIKQSYRIDVIAFEGQQLHWLKNAITA